MNKFLALALCSSIGMNVYLMTEEVAVHDDLDTEMIEEVDDAISLAQSGIQRQEADIKKEKNFRSPPRAVEEKDFKEEDFDEAEYTEFIRKNSQAWKQRVTDLVEVKLGLPTTVVGKYEMIKLKRDEEIDAFFNAKRQQDDEVYYVDLEDRVALAEIDKKYLSSIKKLFGENYERFQKLRAEYNQENRSQKYFFPIDL